MAVHLAAMKAVKRGHHGLHAGANRGRVAGRMNIAELAFGDVCFALVSSTCRASVADEVLGAG